MCVRVWAAAILCLLTGGSCPALAQTITATTGAAYGVVSDDTGAVLPGVSVTLSGPALLLAVTTVTDGAGVYRFSAVPPGSYTLNFDLIGFAAMVRQDIHVALGFTVTVDVAMRPGTFTDVVTVSGASPVIDVTSTAVATHFDAETLAALPGARDIFAVLAHTPGVAMSKMDVGGNTGLALQEYTAYGLRSITGINRNDVEGIRVGGANGPNDNYFSDFASFDEIAVKAVGHSAAMPVPGTMVQYVSKSGGNAYHGSVYTDYQNDSLEAANIDEEQIALGVVGGPGADARNVNRLKRFRDLTADAGGYLKKDRAWWYAAFRSTALAQSLTWLIDTPAELNASVRTGKITYSLSPRQKLVAYAQHETFTQSSYFVAGTNPPIQSSDALPSIVFPVNVWKVEYNASMTDALYAEVRVGGYHSDAATTFKSTAARVADVGANTVRGGANAQERLINRPQANGSISFFKNAKAGSHTFTAGGEYMSDRVVMTHSGYGNACNCVSTLNNGVPAQVQLLSGPNVSRNDLVTSSAFVDDTWRPGARMTVSLGLRLDRYQPILPAQEGPTGQMFAAIDPVLTFSNWGPRLGMSLDLTGDARTVLKIHYGTFWLYPSPIFTSALNPNPAGWSQTYIWTNDANSNGRWDAGEEGRLTGVSGGIASTRLDTGIENTFVRQASAYVEREVAPGFGLRTGFVMNARRQPYGTIDVSRPLEAYSVPVTVMDPGPDGTIGSADDGGGLTAYNLTDDAVNAAPVNLTTNLRDADSEYYTWEITATKRHGSRWSLLASLTTTWSHEAALGTGNDFTPNALINSSGTQDLFSTWQAKVNSTISLPYDLQVVPLVRYQSGQPFARTFVQTLNYGNATIKSELLSANRTPDILLADVRTEKTFRINTARVIGFFDVYNIFNTNAPQTLTTSSGRFWLRPTAITAPRVARIGGRVEW